MPSWPAARTARRISSALEIVEKAFGPDHPYAAASLNNLAGLYRTQGRYTEAEPLHQRVLEILELDEKAQIDIPHLLAALALWEHAEASARHVFGASLGDPVAR